MPLTPGDIVQHKDGSIGVYHGQFESSYNSVPRIEWIADAKPGIKQFWGTANPDNLTVVGRVEEWH